MFATSWDSNVSDRTLARARLAESFIRHRELHLLSTLFLFVFSEALCRDVMQKEIRSGDQMLGDVGGVQAR
jgi:hypothetical protein